MNTFNNSNGKENNDITEASSTSIMPDPQKVTVFMKRSLNQLHSSLTCHICSQMLNDPSTLACAHTFCWKCIEEFSSNNSLCPMEGCGIPLSMTGSRKKTNPSIETVLSSFQTICSALDKAPNQWWQHGKDDADDPENDTEMTLHSNPNNHHHEDEAAHDSSSDEEMIVLNADTTTKSRGDSQGSADDDDGEESANWLGNINVDSDDDDDE